MLWLVAISPASAAEGKFVLLEKPEPLPAGAVYYDAKDAAQPVSGLQGKVVVLHFWATWCAPCIVELPEMQKAVSTLPAKDVAVIPISLDFKPEVVEAFFTAKGLGYPVWLDKKSALLRSLGIKGLPGTVILNRKGEIIARHSGAIDWVSPQTVGFLQSRIKD